MQVERGTRYSVIRGSAFEGSNPSPATPGITTPVTSGNVATGAFTGPPASSLNTRYLQGPASAPCPQNQTGRTARRYLGSVPWTDAYTFGGDFEDLRGSETARPFAEELARELSPGHPLHGRTWSVVARVIPQDDVIALSGDDVFLVHLTWTQRLEPLPWPETVALASAAEFESITHDRY